MMNILENYEQHINIFVVPSHYFHHIIITLCIKCRYSKQLALYILTYKQFLDNIEWYPREINFEKESFAFYLEIENIIVIIEENPVFPLTKIKIMNINEIIMLCRVHSWFNAKCCCLWKIKVRDDHIRILLRE